MIESLQSFIEGLRGRGLAISPAEAIDAARAAALVGPEDRARFRSALMTTLAKDLKSLWIFDETFENFFLPPARVRGAGGPRDKGAGPGSGGRVAPDPEAPAVTKPATMEESEPGRGRTARFPPSRAERRAGSSLRPVHSREIIRQLASTAEGTRRNDEGSRRAGRDTPGIRGRVRPESSDRRDVRQGHLETEAVPARRPRLARLLAAEPSRTSESSPGGDARDPRRRDLAAPMTTAEERQIAREIPRLVEELRLRHGRRMRRAPRGRLWMKRAIRENLSTGGVPFRVPMRLPKRKRPRLVLLVDISWSVARAAGLFLLLAMEFLKLDRRTKIFFFVDHPLDGTDCVRAWLRRSPGGRVVGGTPPAAAHSGRPLRPDARIVPGSRGRSAACGILSPETGCSFLDAIHSVSGLDPGAASDYGRAFYALASGALRTLARDSVVVVLGDARSNVFDPLPWAFEEIAARARRVIWLAPEPRSRWGTGDSALLRYLAFCDVAVETRDLEGLAHGIRELAASL